jgi:ArsR family transcriptional regulator
MDQSLSRLKAIADPGRLRVMALVNKAGEICVCQIEAAMNSSQPSVSHYLNRLKEGGWLQARRQGKWMYYRLADPEESPWRTVLEVILADAGNSALVQEDLERLKSPVKCNGGLDPKLSALGRTDMVAD